ncbi:MAG: phosphonate ABC transporter ATP-binding protein [Gemella sp.]|nr:phosphonate ABC transporter ATP-binding protein [Gemella sp.]
MEKALEVKNLSVSYSDVKVLNELSFSLNKGEFVAVLGLSGAGKSTLLRSLNRLTESDGQILINNQDINKLNNKELKNFRRKISFIFQDYNIIDGLYTIENVLSPFLAYKNIFQSLLSLYTKEEYALALKYLDRVGLSDFAYTKSKYLSGGQKQRVAIAKAICQKPELLLADEPISSLDEANAESVMELFKRLNRKKNLTILMNLHDVAIAKKYSDKILALKDGKILFFKETEKVSEEEFKDLYNRKI